ncbi:MAG: ACT domain-containing protein [Acidimicrobiia bacterium]|nr:ACT domain-containing protein [Acidimicrobiia bacterium]
MSRVHRFAVWALGVDRPGIVAAVTGALFEQGGNLSDCSMTILSGHFAMVLVVEAPPDVDVGSLEEALAAPAAAFDLGVAVRPIRDEDRPVGGGAPFVVSVYGADKPGIVHHVSALLAESGVNITDLETRRIGDPDDPVYAMLLEVVLPASLAPDELRAALSEAAEELGVDASLHEAEADVL